MVDALDSKSSIRKDVEVQVLSPAQNIKHRDIGVLYFVPEE